MNTKLWINKATSMCLMVAILATYSMVALAGGARASGELIVGENSNVTVNGEVAKSGLTIFTSSKISTPKDAGALINLGKAGQIELAPSTSVTLSFDRNAINADLGSGTVTVLRSASPVNVSSAGTSHVLAAGESATYAPGKDDQRDTNGKCVDTDKDGDEDCDDGGAAWWAWALVFGGAAAGILIAASQSGNNQFGGGGTVVSPTR